jgi:hypothetical protein
MMRSRRQIRAGPELRRERTAIRERPSGMMIVEGTLSHGGASRERSALALIAFAAVCLLVAGSAHASTASLDGTTGLIGVRTADLQVTGVLSASIGAHYYESADLAQALGCDPGRYVSLHLAASYGVTTWLEAGFDLPFRRASWPCDEGADRSVQAIDNPSLALKLALLPSLGPVRVSALARFGLPVDEELVVDPGTGESIYITGGPRPDWQVLLLATADFTDRIPLRLHLNAGWEAHREDGRGRSFHPVYYPSVPAGGDPTDNDALLLRAAVEFPGRAVDLFTEFRGDLIRDSNVIAAKENALAITPGVRVRFGGGFSATVGFGVGISGNDRSTEDFDPHEAFPDWEASVALSWTWPIRTADSDGDGIPDFKDECPSRGEDIDGHEDDDGCPDLDNDGDGIPDDVDGDPELPEDLDGFEDRDGVPDLDNDSDGIVDERDMCPNEAEDLDGFEDEDGCPDT